MASSISTASSTRARYAELHCRSYFSFLDGASSPEALIERAAELGYGGLALTDVDGVHGAPRGHLEARARGFRFAAGSELTVADDLAPPARRDRGGPAAPGDDRPPARRVVLLARTAAGWANLCRLVTRGRLRCDKGAAWVTWDEVTAAADGLVVLSGGAGGPLDAAWRRRDLGAALAWARRLAAAFGDRAFIELTHHLEPGDDQRVVDLAQLADTVRLGRVVTGDVRHARPGEAVLCDVQACIRGRLTLQTAGRALAANRERSLHTPAELAARFRRYPDALARTGEIMDSLGFSLDELRYRFPAVDAEPGETPFSRLHHLVHEGARARYRPMTPRAAAQIGHELAVIEKLGLAGYFLIVWDIVRFCRERGILCQGRGSAANSAVCYALGITAIDPVGMELLFERFLSEERDEMPDIDLDLASDRREEAIQYVYRRFGTDRAAMACNVVSYHARSAIRDVGKALGLSEPQVDRAAKAMDRFLPDPSPLGVQTNFQYGGVPAAARDALRRETGLDLGDPMTARVFAIAQAFEGMPRHLGVHSGGVVITAGPTWEVVPVENATMAQRTVVQWDKDDLNALGIIKIDLLGLGMLTAIDHGVRLIEEHHGERIDLAHLPPDDVEVYDMICRADTIGTFQIESRAQMNMLPRLMPRTFYDLVVEVAIIRPGPIQGEMIHPYLKRRNGLEPVTYAHPSLEPALRRTLGVPLFQEQGMKLAIAAAGFTPGEADELRRAMGHKRSHAKMARLRQRLIDGMAQNGIDAALGERIFKQLGAFADYGFPESHAASFALIVYASCWLKHHYPAAFLAGLLNAQPMGFYARNTLIADARRHGVAVLPPCARRSRFLTCLEGDDRAPAVRLGFREIAGVGDAHQAPLEQALATAPFASPIDVARRSGLPRPALARLAAADGFAAFGVERREALWQVAALPADFAAEPLFGDEVYRAATDERAGLAPMAPAERMQADFAALGLSIEAHPMGLARPALAAAGLRPAAEINASARHGQRAEVAGMVITRQRPGSAKGMLFITLEDETGLVNLVVTPPVFERYRTIARGELFLRAAGTLEREGRVVNLLVHSLTRLDAFPEPPPRLASRDFR